MEILVVTLLKRHKMFNVLVAFFLKIFETLKAHIPGTEAETDPPSSPGGGGGISELTDRPGVCHFGS